jgi:hypothetical protein
MNALTEKQLFFIPRSSFGVQRLKLRRVILV